MRIMTAVVVEQQVGLLSLGFAKQFAWMSSPAVWSAVPGKVDRFISSWRLGAISVLKSTLIR
jgi:hypothetical protein